MEMWNFPGKLASSKLGHDGPWAGYECLLGPIVQVGLWAFKTEVGPVSTCFKMSETFYLITELISIRPFGQITFSL